MFASIKLQDFCLNYSLFPASLSTRNESMRRYFKTGEEKNVSNKSSLYVLAQQT